MDAKYALSSTSARVVVAGANVILAAWRSALAIDAQVPSCYDMLCYDMLYYVMSCYVMSRHDMLCYVMLLLYCVVMSCYIML